MDVYRLMVRLAILQKCAAGIPLEERNKRAQVSAAQAEQLLAAPAYQEVVHAVDAAWSLAATPRVLAEHIADPYLQHKIAQRTVRLALHAGDTRVASRALEQVNDRAMPPPAVQKGETRVLVVSAETAALIDESLKLVAARQLALAAGIDPDG